MRYPRKYNTTYDEYSDHLAVGQKLEGSKYMYGAMSSL